jgi:leucyl/phenylalanyl-tRNA---protein transferase
MKQLYWLKPELWFPSPSEAFEDPNGLLAVGGDLSAERLKLAYANGIFPWYSDDQPILWWSPNPRCVLFPEKVHVSRSLGKTLRKNVFDVTMDQDFAGVIRACAATRCETGTWITSDMEHAYTQLHQQGLAHSVECWYQDTLVGGLYGLAMGRCFFGESMFSRMTDASKVAFVHLARQLQNWNYALIDCQVENEHLLSLGAETISRDLFLTILSNNRSAQPAPHRWKFEGSLQAD